MASSPKANGQALMTRTTLRMEDARIQTTMKIPTQRILIDSRQSWQAAMKIPIIVMNRNKAVKISEIKAQIVVA